MTSKTSLNKGLSKAMLMPKKRATVYLWTGSGWGKTTSALGVALRAIGHGKNVVIIQFMKGWGDNIGEYRVRHRLAPDYQIYQFGRKEWVNLKNPAKIDKDLAKKALAFAQEMAKQKPFLLILDEVNVAIATGLISLESVLKFLDKVPKETTVYLTGRYAHQRLIDRADYVTEVIPIKRPKRYTGAKPGIDY